MRSTQYVSAAPPPSLPPCPPQPCPPQPAPACHHHPPTAPCIDFCLQAHPPIPPSLLTIPSCGPGLHIYTYAHTFWEASIKGLLASSWLPWQWKDMVTGIPLAGPMAAALTSAPLPCAKVLFLGEQGIYGYFPLWLGRTLGTTLGYLWIPSICSMHSILPFLSVCNCLVPLCTVEGTPNSQVEVNPL